MFATIKPTCTDCRTGKDGHCRMAPGKNATQMLGKLDPERKGATCHENGWMPP